MKKEVEKHSLGIILFTTGMSYFMIQQALTPVATVLPSMAKFFGIDPMTAGWVTNIYLLFLTSFLLVAGRMGDLYGHETIFTWGVVFFTVFSALAGFAASITQILLWRALQGLASALILANCLAIVSNAFPDNKRGTAIGLVTMASALGTLLGTLLGSIFIKYLTWRWTFLIIIPLGIISFAGTRLFPALARKPVHKGVNFWSGILIFLLLATLTLSFGHSHTDNMNAMSWYQSPKMRWIALAIFLVLIVWEWRHKAPLLVLHHFKNPQFSLALIGNIILHMTMMGPIYLIPFLLEQMGLSVGYAAGLLMLFSFMNTVFSPISGRIHDRYGFPWLRAAAAGTISIGLAGLGLAGGLTGFAGLVVFSIIVGLGLGFFLTPNNTVIMGALPRQDRGFASGMLETTRQLGHSVAITVSGAVLALGQKGAGMAMDHPVIGDYRRTLLVMALISLVGVVAAMVRTQRVTEVSTLPQVLPPN